MLLNYTIGKVSKLTKISIKSLRYYDDIGLVTPIKRDNNSNYRYYSQDQLLTLDLIRYLNNDLSLPLSDIKTFIQNNGTNQNGLIKYLDNKEQEFEVKIQNLYQTKFQPHQKIETLKQNQKTLFNIPIIKQYPERKYYLQTTNTTTCHNTIQDEMLKFFAIFRPKENSKMCAFFFTNMKDNNSHWENNSIAMITEEYRNLHSFLLPKGEYITLPFIFSPQFFETSLKTLKSYIEEQHYFVENKFYLVIDIIDGAAALDTVGYMLELQAYILPNTN